VADAAFNKLAMAVKAADAAGKLDDAAAGVGTAVWKAVAFGEAVAGEASEASTAMVSVASSASKVLGPVAGGLGAATGVVSIGLAAHEWWSGHPEGNICKALWERLSRLEDQYSDEPDSEPKRTLMSVFASMRGLLDAIMHDAEVYRHSKGASNTTSGALGTASGVCAAVAPFTLGATGVVAIGLGGASTAISTLTSVSDSWSSFGFRKRILQAITGIWQAQVAYSAQVPSSKHRYRSEPHELKFEANRWCQRWMTVKYKTKDQEQITVLSTDKGEWDGWYGTTMMIDPEASDIEVSFDVRGGSEIKAVDRSASSRPWCKDGKGKCYKEVFKFDGRQTVVAKFELVGTSLHSYVRSCSFNQPGLA